MDDKVKWCPQNFQVWVAFVMGMVVIIIAIVLFDNVLGKRQSGSSIPSLRSVEIDTKGIDATISSNLQSISFLKDSEEEKAWLGIEPLDVTEQMAKEMDIKVSKGVLVSRVVSNSPAEKAGLLRGDIIYEFDHRQVTDTAKLSLLISKSDPDDRVKIGLFRKDDRIVVYAVLGEIENDVADSSSYLKKTSGDTTNSNQSLGLVVSNLNLALRQQYSIPADEQGVLVMMVIEGSLAFNAGVKKGDLIRQINQVKIDKILDFFDALKSSENAVVLDIIRNGSNLYITITSLPPKAFAVAQEGIGMNRPLYVPGYDQTQSGDPDSKTNNQIYYDSYLLYNNNNLLDLNKTYNYNNLNNNTGTNSNNSTNNLNNYIKL